MEDFNQNTSENHLLVYRITLMAQVGLLQKWKRRLWPEDKCTLLKNEKKHSTHSITIPDIMGIFIALFSGIIISFAAFTLEILMKKYRRILCEKYQFNIKDSLTGSQRIMLYSTNLKTKRDFGDAQYLLKYSFGTTRTRK